MISGFQQSRYGYNSLANMKKAVNRTLNAEIPLDVQYAVKNLMFFFLFFS